MTNPIAAGSTDLEAMLRTLEVTVRPDEYVYVTVPPAHPAVTDAAAFIDEDEGRTLVLRRSVAENHALEPEFVAAWLTLTVHSSLDAIGLTAAVSRRLADEGIPCNVLAGAHHDHLLVPAADSARAVAALRSLRASA